MASNLANVCRLAFGPHFDSALSVYHLDRGEVRMLSVCVSRVLL